MVGKALCVLRRFCVNSPLYSARSRFRIADFNVNRTLVASSFKYMLSFLS